MAETLVWRDKVHSTTCQSAIAQSNRSTGQLVKAALNSGQRLVKGERFNCKYWYFWMSLQNWTIGLKMGYLEN